MRSFSLVIETVTVNNKQRREEENWGGKRRGNRERDLKRERGVITHPGSLLLSSGGDRCPVTVKLNTSESFTFLPNDVTVITVTTGKSRWYKNKFFVKIEKCISKDTTIV